MSKKHNLSQPYFIKQDMSPEQRKIQALLLKERWNLIQSGVPRSEIQIRNTRLLVKGKLHGQVKNFEFQYLQVTKVNPSETSVASDLCNTNDLLVCGNMPQSQTDIAIASDEQELSGANSALNSPASNTTVQSNINNSKESV